MSSSSSHVTVTYTSISTDSDLSPWGFHLMEEDQPQPVDASPTADSPDYIADSKPTEDDFEEDLKMDHVDYVDDDDDDDDEEEEEKFSDDEDGEASSSDRLRTVYTCISHTSPSPSAEARIAEYDAVSTPQSPSPSPLLLLSSPIPVIPSPPLLLPSPTRRDIIPEADMPLRKRARFTAPFYSIRATDERVMTALEGVNERMTDLAATHRHDSEEFHTRHQDAQDDRALLRACISTLEREIESDVIFALCPFLMRERPVMLVEHKLIPRTVGHDAAYGMTWKTLMKMLTGKYYPRSEIKKLEIEIWNLKVKGTDVMSYTQRFQELALMCGRMFLEESDQVEKYVGGFPDMIQGSVMASKPKTMPEAIEFSNDLMNQKIRTFAKRQAENKRKLDDN
nr:reverse transcriptase domain-containing protein [Tanacetum cinerariifolium]